MDTHEHFESGSENKVGLGPISRREFLQVTGGGILVYFFAGDDAWAASGRGLPSDFNAFLLVGENGRVSCFTGKIEMGQGVMTSFAQMLADELDVPFESVDMVMGDTSRCPYDRGTFGSMSTRFFGPALRKAGAEARAVLLELGAEQLKVPLERLEAKNGAVFDTEHPDKKLTYAQLTKGKKIERTVKQEAHIKEVAALNEIGRPRVRTDGRDKVTGKAQYTGDIRVKGMLYAKILRPPAHGAQLKNVDTSVAEKMKGVQVVRDKDLVAVLHEKPDVAEKALAAIKAEFSTPEANVDDETIFQHLLEVASGNGREVQPAKGDLENGAQGAKATVEKTYYNSYVMHAAMETHSALAQVEGDSITVWASTQTPFPVQEEIARTLEMPVEKVRVIAPFVGGGFGGKSRTLQGIEAARLAKLTKKPVQVVFSRAEEFFYDTFRPAALVKIKSAIDASGRIVLWDYGVYFAGDRGSAFFYDAPNLRTLSFSETKGGSAHPFATGPWRAPANNTNTFGRESHMDVLAEAAGMDPVEFRLKNLTDERMVRVLKAAAEKFAWKPAKAPSGRGFGVSCGIDSGTYVCAMAEVEVNKDAGAVKVKRIVCAQDMGLVVNPEGAKMQMEGCVTMGLGYALTEEVHFKGGKISDVNFGSYKLPRFSWLPEIEPVLVENKELAPQGGGEPSIINMGGVIANAVFDATGARVYHLPMTPERIRETISKRA